LRSLGKEVEILNPDPIPQKFKFLFHDNVKHEIFSERPEQIAEISSKDAIFVMDISDWSRMGKLSTYLQDSKAKIICIDHHISNNRYADMSVLDPRASSAGELVYKFIKENGYSLDMDIANSIYVAVLTDTGAFKYSNAGYSAHLIAADLINFGVKSRIIYKKLYETFSIERMRLLGQALASLQTTSDCRIAWLKITSMMFKETGTRSEDIDGFLDFPRSLKNVEIAMIFLENGNNEIKISFRSEGNIDVNELAKEFGGGGHRQASGAIVSGKLEKVIETVVKRAENFLK
jgi:phosphoesterase RecJ-like protein